MLLENAADSRRSFRIDRASAAFDFPISADLAHHNVSIGEAAL
jgi:hypothetical protein